MQLKWHSSVETCEGHWSCWGTSHHPPLQCGEFFGTEPWSCCPQAERSHDVVHLTIVYSFHAVIVDEGDWAPFR